MKDEESKRMEGDDGYDKNIRVIKSKFLKFWPSKESHAAWRNFVFQECVDQNINALYIAVRILQKITEQFVQKQIDGLQKKQKKEQKMQQSSRARGGKDAKDAANRKDKQ